MPRAKGMVIGFWIVTALFCLQMSFTAYAQLRFPQVSEAFTHLASPAYFRVELSWAKLLGVVLLLAPVPARLKEWAYAGFASGPLVNRCGADAELFRRPGAPSATARRRPKSLAAKSVAAWLALECR